MVLLGAQALALAGVGVLGAVELLRGAAADTAAGVVTVLVALGAGAFLLTCARALWVGRRWARAPAVTWQLLQLAVALPAARGDAPAVGIALVVVSLVVTGIVLSAPVRAWTAQVPDPSDPPVA